jgi:hypothetical protein
LRNVESGGICIDADTHEKTAVIGYPCHNMGGNQVKQGSMVTFKKTNFNANKNMFPSSTG